VSSPLSSACSTECVADPNTVIDSLGSKSYGWDAIRGMTLDQSKRNADSLAYLGKILHQTHQVILLKVSESGLTANQELV
jgi:hypothetical protein